MKHSSSSTSVADPGFEYKILIYSNIAFTSPCACAISPHSAVRIVDQKDSILEYSHQWPVAWNADIRPASRISLANARDVNWAPGSAWRISPTPGCPAWIAMSSTLTTRSVSWLDSMNQPTISREKVHHRAAVDLPFSGWMLGNVRHP